MAWIIAILAVIGCSPVIAEQFEGTVRRIAGRTLLVDTDAGAEVLTLERGGSLTGVESLHRAPWEVPVSVTWSREVAGVKLAEVVAFAPEVIADAGIWIDVTELSERRQAEDSRQSPTVIDSRSLHRFRAGHIPGALSISDQEVDRPESLLPPGKESPLVFYSEGPRCGLAQQGAREAIRLGYTNVKVLRGGLQTWCMYGGHLVAEVTYVAEQIAASSRAYLPVDVAAAGGEGSTLPGAASVPLEAITRDEFLGSVWMPSLLFVGEDGDDPRPLQAVEMVRRWRQGDFESSQLPIYILAGGKKAWVEAGQPTIRLEDAPRSIAYPVDPARGELYMEEFLDLWALRGDGETVILDVRGPSAAPPEGVTHIPLEELHERVTELPRDREIVAYCTFGNRSAIAYLILSRLGYDVRFLPFTPDFLR